MAPGPIGRFVAKVLFIDLDYRHRNEPEEALNSAARSLSEHEIEQYAEQEPTIREFLHEHWPSGTDVAHYFRGLFPFHAWILHYNLTWLLGDLVAGNGPAFSVAPTSARKRLTVMHPYRYNGRLRRHPPGHGIRPPGEAAA
jgi:solute carrier family 26 (sodium-independent sulfate anion transporter), member 11